MINMEEQSNSDGEIDIHQLEALMRNPKFAALFSKKTAFQGDGIY